MMHVDAGNACRGKLAEGEKQHEKRVGIEAKEHGGVQGSGGCRDGGGTKHMQQEDDKTMWDGIKRGQEPGGERNGEYSRTVVCRKTVEMMD